MQRVLRAFTGSCFFLVCYAPVPIIAGNMFLNNGLCALIILMLILPVCFLLSYVPGHVGGRKQQTVVRTTVRSSDPDPDRGLRSEDLPEEAAAFPLRAVVCALLCVGIVIAVCIVDIEPLSSAGIASRLTMGAIMAGMLPLALRMVALNENRALNVASGMALYTVAGVISFFVGKPELEGWLLGCGLVFLVMAAFAMNTHSMNDGTHSPDGVRPPAAMRQKNRVLLAAALAVGGLTAYFAQIRDAVFAAGRWVLGRCWNAILWLLNQGATRPLSEMTSEETIEMTEELLEQAEELAAQMAEEAEMGTTMIEMFGGETGAFWAGTESTLAWICVLVVAVGLFFWGRVIIRLIKEAIKKIIAKLKILGEAVSEGYVDEQESLLDWDETRRRLGDGLRERFRIRPRVRVNWEGMSVKERMRYIVRSVYARTKDAHLLRSLTVHEAAPHLKTGGADPKVLSELYDRARYGQGEMDAEAVEQMRKEAKV